MENRVTVDDILTHGKFELVEGWNDAEHLAFIEEIHTSKRFEVPLQPNELKNVADYFRMISLENVVVLYEHIGEAFQSLTFRGCFNPEFICASNLVKMYEYIYENGQKFSQLLELAVDERVKREQEESEKILDTHKIFR